MDVYHSLTEIRLHTSQDHFKSKYRENRLPISNNKCDIILIFDDREKISYDCKKCDFKTEKRQTAKSHHRSVHLGIVYFCDEEGCNLKVTQKGTLKRHKEAKHKNQEAENSMNSSFSSTKSVIIKIKKDPQKSNNFPIFITKKI